MNVQHRLIQELMLHVFELGQNAEERTKIIYCVKGEKAVDHISVTR